MNTIRPSPAGDAVCRAQRRRGIEVARAGDAGQIRVVPVAVPRADHLLEDDGHLLFLQPVGRGLEVRLGVLGERGQREADRAVRGEYWKTGEGLIGKRRNAKRMNDPYLDL